MVLAEEAGADGAREMLAEGGMHGADLLDGGADAAGDVQEGALGRGAGATGAAAEADGAGQLARQHLDLGLGAGGALGVAETLRFLERFAELDEALLVGGARLGVEHFAGVTQVVNGESSLGDLAPAWRL